MVRFPVACAFLLALGGANADYIPDGSLRKIKHILSSKLADLKDNLAGEVTEGAFCKRETTQVREKVAQQSEAVREKLASVEAAEAANARAKAAEDGQELTEKQEQAAEKAQSRSTADAVAHAKDVAIWEGWFMTPAELRGEVFLSRHEPLGQPIERGKKTKTEKKVEYAKYELKEEMTTLRNYEKQVDLLRERCVQPSSARTYEDKRASRQEQIDGLSSAWDFMKDAGR